jgi:hypothetical protein
MRLLFDADMPAHETGHLTKKETFTDGDGITTETTMVDDEGKPVLLDWEDVEPLAKGRFMSIFIASECGGFSAFLTKGKCFRHGIASIQPYKGHREDKDRGWVDRVKDLYHETFGAKWCEGYEADDAISMAAWKEYERLAKRYKKEETIRKHAELVQGTRDKDLDTVPGWHFKWPLGKDPEQPPYWVDKTEATRNFYKMLLMGDQADHVKGLFGVGKKSALVKELDTIDDEQEMWDHVEAKYVQRFGAWARKFLDETCQLLWLWRRPHDKFVPPHERDEFWKL